MGRDKGKDIYKTAIFLSVVVHIFCVTGAEAALSFSKKINLVPTLTFITLPFSAEKLPVKSSEITKQTTLERAPASTTDLVQIKSKPKVRKPVVIEKINKFKSHQNLLNERIQSIKKEIVKKQVQMLQSVSSSVYDADKIPVGMRKSVLPDYLKRMRSQITSRWLLMLQSVKCRSCSSIVEYRIDQTGKISGLKLLSASGDKNFDDVCMKSVMEPADSNSSSF